MQNFRKMLDKVESDRQPRTTYELEFFSDLLDDQPVFDQVKKEFFYALVDTTEYPALMTFIHPVTLQGQDGLLAWRNLANRYARRTAMDRLAECCSFC